jgi:hypothetical protein
MVRLQAQEKELIYEIIENYDHKDSTHYTHCQDKDEFNHREIKDGIYSARSLTILGPELRFSSRINQFKCIYSSEMEFTLVNLKGGKDAFIGVKLLIRSEKDLNYPRFVYNENGEWKLFKTYDVVKQSGTTAVNPKTNVLKIVFNKTYLEYYLNGNKVCEHKLYETNRLEWGDIKIEGDKKMKIGLDRLVLRGYYDNENPDMDEYNAERFMNGITSLGYQKGFVLRDKKGKYRFVSLRGRISEVTFDDYSKMVSGPLFRFRMTNPERYGYLDWTGKLVVPAEFVSADSDPSGSDDKCPKGCYTVKDKEGKEYLINDKGEKFARNK